MNKAEFVSHIAKQYNCSKVRADEIINMFTSSVIDALGSGKEVSLAGFGHFTVSPVAARTGRNPRTGEPLQIKAYNQPKFKSGQRMKDACNR
ncbi:MAG: integration host factor [Rickettsiales bacterium]|nr:MAG: integration host factor [Rickettsiales bacterium]